MARHVGIKCGVPIGVPALAVNRLCGSGFQAIANGAQASFLFVLAAASYYCVPEITLFGIGASKGCNNLLKLSFMGKIFSR